MTETKHEGFTPGPLFALGNGIYKDTYAFRIGSVYSAGSQLSDAEMFANVRLFSDAPNLYAQLKEAEAEIAELRKTLKWVIDDVQEWCDAVSEDASWDGWDSHYKSFTYGGLDKARKALAEIAREK